MIPRLNKMVKVYLLLLVLYVKNAASACERSPRIIGAEDYCWSNKVKITERIQYTTKSVLNFAKEKLGLGVEEPYYPQQCDYYQCIFGELHLVNERGYPDYDKIVEWIDNNIIYNHAKTQYDTLGQCNSQLTESVNSNTFFSGDLDFDSDGVPLQSTCEVVKEYMKCLASNSTECIIFTYP